MLGRKVNIPKIEFGKKVHVSHGFGMKIHEIRHLPMGGRFTDDTTQKKIDTPEK